MNPRRRARLRRRRHLRAWVKTWEHGTSRDDLRLSTWMDLRNWAQVWTIYARTGDSFELDCADAHKEPGWRRWGVRAGLRAYRRGHRP